MNKNGIQTYALTVCFLCVAVILFFGSYAINNFIQYSFPEFTISTSEQRRHSSNELYEQHLIKMSRYNSGDARIVEAGNKERIVLSSLNKDTIKENSSYTLLSQEELTLRRNESWGFSIQSEKKRGIKGLVRESVTVLVAIILLFIHWKIANRQKQLTSQASAMP